jgi:hypothetical protein
MDRIGKKKTRRRVGIRAGWFLHLQGAVRSRQRSGAGFAPGDRSSRIEEAVGFEPDNFLILVE